MPIYIFRIVFSGFHYYSIEIMASGGSQRKLWTEESMAAAVATVKEGKGLRETSRLYNVPLETLRRRVTGAVELGCRPGPPTVLNESEEEQLSQYLVQMADVGFGLTREDIMRLAFNIAEKSGRKHPFSGNKAGRGWFEGFKARHPKLTLRTPQPLSYCRALCSNQEVIDDFFGKLGAIYGRLNLVAKPMQVFNADETGISVVHKPGKVVAELGWHYVYALTSAEKGKIHTILTCVSASGFVLPPMMVYPRKKKVPEHMREGAVPNTMFAVSESGWMNKDLYLDWFQFFIDNIPPTRPVLLLQDGHGSHVSIELIELARKNDIHLLCFPAHTSHILQPLDVGVFKSFKLNFSKACHAYISNHPGQVITTAVIASLVADAWPHSLTPLNILSGFKKCGIHPLNPGEVNDRQLAPSKALRAEKSQPDKEPDNLFTREQESLYKRRFEEGYDVHDPSYIAWLRINHPDTSPPCSVSAVSTQKSSLTGSSSSGILSELLVLPQPEKKSNRKRKPALNNKTVCLTDSEVLEELKTKEKEKIAAEETKKAKQLERKRKRLEKEEKKKEKESLRKEKTKRKQPVRKRVSPPPLDQMVTKLTMSDSEDEEDNTVCPKCGLVCKDDPDGFWVCCDACDLWYCLKCTDIPSKNCVPDIFICYKCV